MGPVPLGGHCRYSPDGMERRWLLRHVDLARREEPEGSSSPREAPFRVLSGVRSIACAPAAPDPGNPAPRRGIVLAASAAPCRQAGAGARGQDRTARRGKGGGAAEPSCSGGHGREPANGIIAQSAQTFQRHVAPAHRPFVILLQHQRSHEPDHRPVIGEDAHHIRTSFDLAVEPLERVGRGNLTPSARAESSCTPAPPRASGPSAR